MTDFSPAELSAVWEVAAAGAALVVHPDEAHWAELVSAVARSAATHKARIDTAAREMLERAGLE